MAPQQPMMKIRAEQMQTLGGYMLQQFEQRMLGLLKTRWREQTKNTADSDLLSWVRQAMQKAADYAILGVTDLERFLLWLWPRGLGFEKLPALAWAVQILTDRNRSATEKLNDLDNYETMVARTIR